MTWFNRLLTTGILSLAGTGSAFATPVLSLVPTAPTVQQGNLATIDVFVSGLESELIGTYDLSLMWDATLLSLSSVSFDEYLDGPADSISGYSAEIGALSIFEVSLAGLDRQVGLSQFRLFSLGFATLDQGFASITFSGPVQILGNELGDEYGAWERRDTLLAITPVPSSVPEPGSLGLIALGAAGAIAARRRRLETEAS